ncbi:MAG: hypothetical protein K0S65_4944, partial [Labilithrix sp.]|nr:hypothetical protein [Labilithrix sp.]
GELGRVLSGRAHQEGVPDRVRGHPEEALEAEEPEPVDFVDAQYDSGSGSNMSGSEWAPSDIAKSAPEARRMRVMFRSC